jgi:antitoxin VapB
MRTAKIFKHGNSQAVRLPKEFRFDGDEVWVKRTAAGVLLLPMRITRERLDAALEPLRGKFERRQPAMQARRWR